MSELLNIFEENSIKSSRFAYRFMLLLCLTSIALTVSPRSLNMYDEAIREINTIDLIDIRSIQKEIVLKEEKINSVYNEYITFFSEHNLQLDISGASQGVIIIEPQPINVKNRPMDEIDNYFNTKELWVHYIPFDSLKNRLLSYFNDRSEHVKALIEKHGPNVNLSSDGSGLKLNYRSVADVIGPPGLKESIPIPINYPSIIHSIPEVRSLVEKTDNEYVLFPNLKKV